MRSGRGGRLNGTIGGGKMLKTGGRIRRMCTLPRRAVQRLRSRICCLRVMAPSVSSRFCRGAVTRCDQVRPGATTSRASGKVVHTHRARSAKDFDEVGVGATFREQVVHQQLFVGVSPLSEIDIDVALSWRSDGLKIASPLLHFAIRQAQVPVQALESAACTRELLVPKVSDVPWLRGCAYELGIEPRETVQAVDAQEYGLDGIVARRQWGGDRHVSAAGTMRPVDSVFAVKRFHLSPRKTKSAGTTRFSRFPEANTRRTKRWGHDHEHNHQLVVFGVRASNDLGTYAILGDLTEEEASSNICSECQRRMACFAAGSRGVATKDDARIKLIRKLVDGLTLQLKRAPFHVMADAITLTTTDLFEQADLVELYVVDPDGVHVSLMSQQPQMDQEAFPSHTKLDKGTRMAEVVRTRQNVLLGPGEMYPERGYKSGMLAPWIQQNTVEGLLLICSKSPHPFPTTDLSYLHLVTSLTNVFSLATKVSSEIRKNRRQSVVPEHILRSSLQVQKYQSSKEVPTTELQDTRILE